ncbi:MAG TPA: hypothetical protein VFV52_03100 [Bacilli bacterium]|nr:hypothetical protein [Bacilli bacterium]
MKLYLSVKQAGKRKGYITNQELNLDPIPSTLRELITQIVRLQVEAYNRKPTQDQLLPYLLPEDMDNLAETGKIGFEQRYNEQQADVHQAIETALLAYQDGLFRVFANEDELTDPDAPLELTEGTVLTFIRFTMLAGRMW